MGHWWTRKGIWRSFFFIPSPPPPKKGKKEIRKNRNKLVMIHE